LIALPVLPFALSLSVGVLALLALFTLPLHGGTI
jgi:hypothetical protein